MELKQTTQKWLEVFNGLKTSNPDVDDKILFGKVYMMIADCFAPIDADIAKEIIENLYLEIFYTPMLELKRALKVACLDHDKELIQELAFEIEAYSSIINFYEHSLN